MVSMPTLAAPVRGAASIERSAAWPSRVLPAGPAPPREHGRLHGRIDARRLDGSGPAPLGAWPCVEVGTGGRSRWTPDHLPVDFEDARFLAIYPYHVVPHDNLLVGGSAPSPFGAPSEAAPSVPWQGSFAFRRNMAGHHLEAKEVHPRAGTARELHEYGGRRRGST